jgi:Arc/MetJ family transcription regulator
MTMHIDDSLLDRVMKTYECSSKTEAVNLALKELDRLARLRKFASTGMGMTPEELKNAVDPDYDVLSMRVAETPAPYGKRRSRR